MGGKHFKGLDVERMDKEKYLEVIDFLKDSKNSFIFECFDIIPSIQEKESFGDVDLLFNVEKYFSFCQKEEGFLKDSFSFEDRAFVEKEISNIVGVADFSWQDQALFFVFDFYGKKVQVECLFTNEKNHEFKKLNFAYNDLGSVLLPIVARQYGLKWSDDGIYKTTEFGKVLVSDNPKVVLEFLDFSYEKYKQGFRTRTEVFEFLRDHPCLNWGDFRLENQSPTFRKNQKNRVLYKELLDYMKANGLYVEPWDYEKSMCMRNERLHLLHMEFPHVRVQEKALEEEHELEEEYKKKVRGQWVMEWTGLTPGKALGTFMNDWVEKEVNEMGGYIEWRNWVINAELENVGERAKSYFSEARLSENKKDEFNESIVDVKLKSGFKM